MTLAQSRQENLYSFIPKVSDFINPKHEENPTKISEFLKVLDLSSIHDQILSKYKNDYHFRYNESAMIKSIVFMRLNKIKSFPKLADYLNAHKDCAENLGFDIKKKLPSKKTLWHFSTKRLDHSWRNIIDGIIQEIVHRARYFGIEIGKEVATDATPIKALENDPGGFFNPHYKKKMYKLYTVIDCKHRIPLAYTVRDGIDGDADNLTPSLYQVKQKGIDFEWVYADGAFESFNNFADVHVVFSANLRTNLGENYVLNDESTEESIKWHYERSWKEAPHYKSSATMNNDIPYMMTVLVDIDKKHSVGNYFRNTLIREIEEAPTEYVEEYKSARTSVEQFHGHFKEQLKIEPNLNRKGLKNVTQYLETCLFSFLCIALNRLQHGTTDGLTDLGGLV